MSQSRPHSLRKARPMAPVRGGFPMPADDLDNTSPHRPAIWADGRQAPGFAPLVFAEAGMLLARDTAVSTLDRLAAGSAARAARLAPQDWRLSARFGRIAALLPTAPGVARELTTFAGRAQAARHLLYGQDAPPRPPEPPAPSAPPTRITAATARLAAQMGAQGQDHPLAAAASSDAPADDPDLAAIRALMRSHPSEDDMTSSSSRTTFSPANWETPLDAPPSGAAPGSPVLRRVMDWGFIRVLAGSALVFATPLGYGRALYRHLDGTDLRDIVADCHRMRIN